MKKTPLFVPLSQQMRQAAAAAASKRKRSGPAAVKAAEVKAFNPNLPIEHTPIVAGELRDQFNGLNALIQLRATPAEVTAAQQSAVAQAQAASSNNSNYVGTLSMSASGYYEQAQLQQVMDKIDELIVALRR